VHRRVPFVALAALACAAALGSARAEPVAYVFDPDHTFVTFEVMHFGTSTIRGRFGGIEGFAEIDRDARRGYVSLQIKPGGVDTGVPAFDARLREGDLLAAAAYPVAYYVASRLYFDGPNVVGVNGELTLRGTSQGLELRALRFGCHMHPTLLREVCGGDFEGELDRGDFGAGFGLPFIANRVRLVVQVEGIRR
jgi:polyisoprenoid-binding protein YceI